MKKFKKLSVKDRERITRNVRHRLLNMEEEKKVMLTRYGRLWFFLEMYNYKSLLDRIQKSWYIVVLLQIALILGCLCLISL